MFFKVTSNPNHYDSMILGNGKQAQNTGKTIPAGGLPHMDHS